MGVVPWPWRRPPAGLSARRGVFGAAPTTRAGAPPLRPLTHPWGGVEGCRLPAACGSRRARRVGPSEAAPLGTARLHRGAPSARLCLSANARMCVGWGWLGVATCGREGAHPGSFMPGSPGPQHAMHHARLPGSGAAGAGGNGYVAPAMVPCGEWSGVGWGRRPGAAM